MFIDVSEGPAAFVIVVGTPQYKQVLSSETSVYSYLAGYMCHISENNNLPVGQFFEYTLANFMLFRTAM